MYSILLLFFLFNFRDHFSVLRKIVVTFISLKPMTGILRTGSRLSPTALVQICDNLSADSRVFSLADGIILVRAGVFISFLDIISEVHLFFHSLKPTSGLVTDAEDCKIVIWIVLGFVLVDVSSGLHV